MQIYVHKMQILLHIMQDKNIIGDILNIIIRKHSFHYMPN